MTKRINHTDDPSYQSELELYASVTSSSDDHTTSIEFETKCKWILTIMGKDDSDIKDVVHAASIVANNAEFGLTHEMYNGFMHYVASTVTDPTTLDLLISSWWREHRDINELDDQGMTPLDLANIAGNNVFISIVNPSVSSLVEDTYLDSTDSTPYLGDSFDCNNQWDAVMEELTAFSVFL